MGRAVLLALLVVLGLPLGVAGVSTGTPAAQADLPDVAILTLNGTARSSFATQSVDVAMAQAVQHDAATARLERYALEERFDNTGTTDARKRLLFESRTAVEIRIANLRDDERALRAAYAARDIDTETFVRRLVRIHARVSGLRAQLDAVQELADDIPEFSIRAQVRLLDASLFGFEGPVRERALAAMRGDEAPFRLFVGVSEDGVAVSAIDDGRYVREVYRADNRDTETVSGLSINEAAALAQALYPDAYNSTTSIRTGIDGLSGGLYRLEIELREGMITAFMDGATRTIFFEVQERRLDLLGPRPSVVGTAEGTRLVVNRSYAGGPLRIAVTDAATGEPIQATVVVEGTPLETGVDGTRWALAPGGPFEVTAVGPRGNVTVSVRPLAPTPVTGEG